MRSSSIASPSLRRRVCEAAKRAVAVYLLTLFASSVGVGLLLATVASAQQNSPIAPSEVPERSERPTLQTQEPTKDSDLPKLDVSAPETLSDAVQSPADAKEAPVVPTGDAQKSEEQGLQAKKSDETSEAELGAVVV